MKEEVWKITASPGTQSHFTVVPNDIFNLSLSPYAVTLYIHLCQFFNVGEPCKLSVRTLAKVCNMSQTSVIKAKKELNRAGLVSEIGR